MLPKTATALLKVRAPFLLVYAALLILRPMIVPVFGLGRSLLAAPTIVAGRLGDAIRRGCLPFLLARIVLSQMGGDDVTEFVQFHGTLESAFGVFLRHSSIIAYVTYLLSKLGTRN